VGSLIGMNVPIPNVGVTDSSSTSPVPFIWITTASLGVAVVLFLGTLGYARSRRILWIPKVPRD